MAQRRMFSPNIVKSEEFMSMPSTSQLLYFHLGMDADDDGFVQPKIVMRVIGAADDDLKVLLAKRFLLVFESGVVVIKHWLIHNLIQKDRYHPTRFQDEKNRLFIKENKAYTEDANSVNRMLPEVRLGKVRLDGRISSKSAHLEEQTEAETQEYTHIRIDDDGQPIDPPKQKPKNDNAQSEFFVSLIKKFQFMCVRKGLPQPIIPGWMRKQVRKDLNESGLTHKQALDLMDVWFEGDHTDEDTIKFNYAFAARNINDYKVRNSVK